MSPSSREHWEQVHSSKAPTEVSWFQALPQVSLDYIEASGAGPQAALLDVGGGISSLVDALLEEGYSRLSVLDISEAALATSKARLGERASRVRWLVGDILHTDLGQSYDLWHDRAVFHFLTTEPEQQQYLTQLRTFLRPGGWVVLATFAEDGPEKCSGLPVARYSAEQLAQYLGPEFTLHRSSHETHLTPQGREQRFTFTLFQRQPAPSA